MASKYQTKIIKQYEKQGWYVINLIRTNKNGITDLLCLKDGVATFIEIKEAKDTLKPLQKHRIDELIKQGFEACCMQEGKGVIYGTKIKQLEK